MNKQQYSGYMQSDHWRDFRAAFRVNFRVCFICGCNTRLEVNHMDYGNLGHENMRDCIMLCHWHHKEFHDRLRARAWPVEREASWAIYRDMQVAYYRRAAPRSRGWKRLLLPWRWFR